MFGLNLFQIWKNLRVFFSLSSADLIQGVEAHIRFKLDALIDRLISETVKLVVGVFSRMSSVLILESINSSVFETSVISSISKCFLSFGGEC